VPENEARFGEASRRFDQENDRDPNRVVASGREMGRELFFAERLAHWVAELDANASESLKLAARCQHIRRWEIPRSAYPLTKAGYHKWRNALKELHAEIAGRILEECGYPKETIERVQELNLKKKFPTDPDARTLEDGLCLVFLEQQLGELARKTEEEKVVNALRKSWGKMSEKARKVALELPLSEVDRGLIKKALSTEA